MANSPRLKGFKWNANDSILEVWVHGTKVAGFDDATNDLHIYENGLTITAGGLTITAGTVTLGEGLTVTGASTFADGVTYSGQLSHTSPNSSTITTDTDLDTNDAGKLILCATDSVTITLPSTAPRLTYTIVATGTAGSAVLYIDPAAADLIRGCDLDGGDGKKLTNTGATHVVGDYVKLIGDSGVGWYIQEMAGTWTVEA